MPTGLSQRVDNYGKKVYQLILSDRNFLLADLQSIDASATFYGRENPSFRTQAGKRPATRMVASSSSTFAEDATSHPKVSSVKKIYKNFTPLPTDARAIYKRVKRWNLTGKRPLSAV